MHSVTFDYAPTCLLDAVVPVSMLSGRMHLRLADNGLYDVPWVSLSVGSGAFSVAGPQATSLPSRVHWWTKKGQGQWMIFSSYGQCFKFPSDL